MRKYGFFCKDDTSSGFNFKVSPERQSSINEAICLETRPAAYEIADQRWPFNLPIFIFFAMPEQKKGLCYITIIIVINTNEMNQAAKKTTYL